METNREIKIAIIVGLIMLTGCLVAFIVVHNKNNTGPTLDLHIYKHVKLDGEKTGKYYECSIASDKLPLINNDFKRIFNLKDSSRETSLEAHLEGLYKVVSGSNFIAFDADGSNLVYRSDTTGLYIFQTETYSLIADACSYISKDTVGSEETNEETEAKETETKETEKKKDTKKDTKTTKKTTTTKKSTKK